MARNVREESRTGDVAGFSHAKYFSFPMMDVANLTLAEAGDNISRLVKDLLLTSHFNEDF
jgi:hypothetical protein